MIGELKVEIFRPQKSLSLYVQGIWAAHFTRGVAKETTKHFFSDGASGFIIILQGELIINDVSHKGCHLWLPPSKSAHAITFSADAVIAGFRFQPAIGALVCNQYPKQVCSILPADNLSLALSSLSHQLMLKHGRWQLITHIYQWLKATLDFPHLVPSFVPHTLKMMTPSIDLTQVTVGQRQLERQFKHWLNMTPVYYRRLLRVNETLQQLRKSVPDNLATMAIECGFSDQAHMTREFKLIAKITPYQFIKKRHDHIDY